MSQRDILEKYIDLLSMLTERKITALEFEKIFFSFKEEYNGEGKDVLYDYFFDVEDFCGIPECFDENTDISEEELIEKTEEVLNELIKIRNTQTFQ